MALRRIEFLEQKFKETYESIKHIRQLESLPQSRFLGERPENKGEDLVSVLDRLDELEYQYGWILNSVTEINEYLGLEPGYYARLPYRWEGPPPATFHYRGKKYFDPRPAVITSTGRAGTTSVILETTAEDENWEVVTRAMASKDLAVVDDRGTLIHIGLSVHSLKLNLRY